MSFIGAARRQAKRSLATVMRKTGMIETRCQRGGAIILMLHKVNDQYDPLPVTLSPTHFDRILSEIKQAGFDIVSMNSLFNDKGEFVQPEKLQFAITFDDGYLDNYEVALPIMQKHQVDSTIYLSYGHVDGKYRFWYELMTNGINATAKTQIDLSDWGLGTIALSSADEKELAIAQLNNWLKQFDNQQRQEYLSSILNKLELSAEQIPVSAMMDWDMVSAMRHAGVDFGSHTLSHPILSKEKLATMRDEVILSKQFIEDKLGHTINGFAYPNGTEDDYDDDTVLAVKDAGYGYAVTTISGTNYADADPFQLKRINLFDGMCTNEQGHFHADFFWAKVTNCF